MRTLVIYALALSATSALRAAAGVSPATLNPQNTPRPTPTAAAQSQTRAVEPASLTHWYRPPDAACPIYTFDPTVVGSDVAAKQACIQHTSKICVSSAGSSVPAC
jgi:hypothetical protein